MPHFMKSTKNKVCKEEHVTIVYNLYILHSHAHIQMYITTCIHMNVFMYIKLQFIFFKDFMYLFMGGRGRDTGRGEKQAPCKEPNMGFDPRTSGSHPWPKAAAHPLSHPGIPAV